MMTKVSVSLKNICKQFTLKESKKTVTVNVLNNVSLEIFKGEVFGIIGRNGSGKSTLLSVIAGIYPIQSGSIEINGSIASILELGMGFNNDLTGRENILIKGLLYGFTKNQLSSKIDQIIAYSELGEYIDAPVRTYSSGMVSRLAFSIMIHVDADILLVDEVLSTGDYAFNSKAYAHFKNLSSSGKTIILVSHSISTISELCGRVAWIQNGSVKEIGSSNVVCNHYLSEMDNDVNILENRARAGEDVAQNLLGLKYKYGDGVNVNFERAFELFTCASENGNVDAKINLAEFYSKGMGVKKDEKYAINLYWQAAEKGNDSARLILSSFYQDSDSINTRNELLNQFIKKIKDTSCLDYGFQYGKILDKIAYTQEDRQRAYAAYLNVAEKGYAPAQYEIGVRLLYGIGLPRNISESLIWLKKSASQDYQYSLKLLGDIYSNGIFAPKNDIEAFKYYVRAAEMGNSESKYHVASMYATGIGASKNEESTFKWIRSIFNDSIFYEYAIMGDEIACSNPELAFKFYIESERSGNSWSKMKLAKAYE